MYKAKELGRNRYELYDASLYVQLQRKNQIENILRHAIEEQALSVVYQPQYDARTASIFGFEALVRLNSKSLGFISPAEFIPIAEEAGFITAIDQWVFREACQQCVKWLEAGFQFKGMSINVSSEDIQRMDFQERIQEVMGSLGIEPKYIELEITETALMRSVDVSMANLKKVKDMGIRIALDDFGTGYSSLNYLRQIPISTLKIDKSFIDHINDSEKEKALIHQIIQMAHIMSLKVVAEGAETEEQYQLLKGQSCDYIQGYYFSKPLSPDACERLMRES